LRGEKLASTFEAALAKKAGKGEKGQASN
jgi:hypothetical protein